MKLEESENIIKMKLEEQVYLYYEMISDQPVISNRPKAGGPTWTDWPTKFSRQIGRQKFADRLSANKINDRYLDLLKK